MSDEVEPDTRAVTRRPNVLLGAALVLLVACAGFAVFFGIGWAGSGQQDEDATGYAQARDEVHRVGIGAIENFTTLDYKRPDDWVRGVSEYTTGELKNDLSSRGNQYKRVMTESQAVLRGKVLDSAVTSLNLREGNAEMIAAVDTTASSARRPDAAPQRLWLQLGLERADNGWKVASLLGAPGITTAGQ